MTGRGRTVEVKRTPEEKTELVIRVVIYIFQIAAIVIVTAGIMIVSKSTSYVSDMKSYIRDSSVVTARVLNVSEVSGRYMRANIEYEFLNTKYTTELNVSMKDMLRNNTLPVYVLNKSPDKPFVNNTNTWETLKIVGYTVSICGIILFFILLKANLMVCKIYKQSSLDDRIEIYKKEGYIDINQIK